MFQQGDNNHNRKRKQPSSPINQSFFRNVAVSLLNIVPRPIAEWFRPSEPNQQPDYTVEQTIDSTVLPPPQKKRRYISTAKDLYDSTNNIETTSCYSVTDEGFNVTCRGQIKPDMLNRVERWVQEPSLTMDSYLKFHQGRGSIKSSERNVRLSKKRVYDSSDEVILDPLQNLDGKSGEKEVPDSIHPNFNMMLPKESDKQRQGHKIPVENNNSANHEISQIRPQKKRCIKSNSIFKQPDQLHVVRTAHKESPKAENNANTRISPKKSFQEQCAQNPQPNVQTTSQETVELQNSSDEPKVNDINVQDCIDWTKQHRIADESKAFNESDSRSNLTNTLDIMRTMFGGVATPSHLKLKNVNKSAMVNKFNVSLGASTNPQSSCTKRSFKTQTIPILKQAAIISVKRKLRINNNQQITVPGSRTSNVTQTFSSDVSQPSHIEPLISENSNKDTECNSSTTQIIDIESRSVTDTSMQQNIGSQNSVSVSTQTSPTDNGMEKSPPKYDINEPKIKSASKLFSTVKSNESPGISKNTSEASSSVNQITSPVTASLCQETSKTLELEKQLKGKEEQERNTILKTKNDEGGHDDKKNEGMKDLAENTKDNSNEANVISGLPKDEGTNLAEKLKSWKCNVCWVINNDDASVCVCCLSKKPMDKIKSQLACSACKNQSNEVNVCHVCSKSNSSIPGVNFMSSFKTRDSAFNKIVSTRPDKWECSICLVKNDKSLSKCVCCKASKPSDCEESDYNRFNFGAKSDNTYNKIVNTQVDKWECSVCLVKNDNSLSKCACCEAPKPGGCKETGSNNFNFGVKSDNTFNKIVNTQVDKWECSVCLVKNDKSLSKCACCEAPKPGGWNETGSNSFNFGVKSDNTINKIVNAQADKWECSVCLVKNENSLSKCACCEAPKPGGWNETGSNSFNFGVKLDNTFNKIVNTQADKWQCSVCLVKNDNSLSKCACCEAPKLRGSNETDTNNFNFGVKENTFNFGIPKVNFKFGIPKEANIQPVIVTASQENDEKRQDTQTVKIDKPNESNNPKEFTPPTIKNLFNFPIVTATSVSPLIATTTSVLQSMNSNEVTDSTVNKSGSSNLIQTNFIKTSTENTLSSLASHPFTMSKHSAHLGEQISAKNVFSNPGTNSVISTENVQENPMSNQNTKLPKFCFTATNSTNISSALPFSNNGALTGSSTEQTNTLNTTGQELTLSSRPPSMAAGCFGVGVQDKVSSNSLVDKAFVSNSTTNTLKSSPAFTFGIPHNTDSGKANVFGLKSSNIFIANPKTSDSQSSIFALAMNQKPDIFGNLQSNSGPSSAVPVFGNSTVSKAIPSTNSISSLSFISSNPTSTNIFGGSQPPSSSIPTANIFGSSQSTQQAPAMGVFGNTNTPAANTDSSSMFTSSNQNAISIFGSPQLTGGQLPVLGGSVFGNANVPPANTTKNDPSLFTTTKQQTPIIFGSSSPSTASQGPAVPVFGNSNAQPQAGNVFNMLGAAAPAPRPLGTGSVFGFGQKPSQQQQQQQPGVYNFAGNQTALPQFNMGSSPTTNMAGRRLRKAVRRNNQR